MKMFRAIVIVLALLLGVACKTTYTTKSVSDTLDTPAPQDDCSAETLSSFITTLNNTAAEFDAAVQTASTTTPENMIPILEEMAAIKERLGEIDLLPCGIKAQAALDNYITSQTQCLTRKWGEAMNGEVTNNLNDSDLLDVCALAADQATFYDTKMDELNTLLLTKQAQGEGLRSFDVFGFG